jgi:predicted nuclease of predicted toxin-antitoxin system
MKFIVDAQLPKRLAYWIKDQGHDVIHTLDLPSQNLTEDGVIIRLSVEQQRVVISKDSDFYEHYILKGTPHKLLMVTTGNIVNKRLIELFQHNFPKICELLESNTIVELNNTELIVHC